MSEKDITKIEDTNWFKEAAKGKKAWEQAKLDLYNNNDCQIYHEVTPDNYHTCRKCGQTFLMVNR